MLTVNVYDYNDMTETILTHKEAAPIIDGVSTGRVRQFAVSQRPVKELSFYYDTENVSLAVPSYYRIDTVAVSPGGEVVTVVLVDLTIG